MEIPQFEYVDRIPTVIDIAGFTRITENSINKVIEYSKLGVEFYTAYKEYDEKNRSYMHMCVEMTEEAIHSSMITANIIKDHLSVYFKNFDHDYNDLKKLLGIDPLKVTILPCGTIDKYKNRFGKSIRTINPKKEEIIELLRIAEWNGGEV